jgi:hypothetical protein
VTDESEDVMAIKNRLFFLFCLFKGILTFWNAKLLFVGPSVIDMTIADENRDDGVVPKRGPAYRKLNGGLWSIVGIR